MIKVGIAGADNPIAGELMRLCLRHPDVEIVSAFAPGVAGRSISSVHHGFIGEPKILFSSHFDATSLDVAFILSPIYSDSDWAKLMADNPSLRMIIFPGAEQVAAALPSNPVYGLSEMNRKPMVRGAREAIVPDPIASPILTALYPLALHLMLSGDLKIKLNAPGDLISEEKIKKSSAEIKRELGAIQSSFNGDVKIEAAPTTHPRQMSVSMILSSATSIDEILKIYDSIYDDHNFTFVVTYSVGPEEVESTDRIIISVSKPSSGELQLDIVSDPRMRGGAGEAIHIMNLFLGLHEKTGLDLKTSAWK